MSTPKRFYICPCCNRMATSRAWNRATRKAHRGREIAPISKMGQDDSHSPNDFSHYCPRCNAGSVSCTIKPYQDGKMLDYCGDCGKVTAVSLTDDGQCRACYEDAMKEEQTC